MSDDADPQAPETDTELLGPQVRLFRRAALARLAQPLWQGEPPALAPWPGWVFLAALALSAAAIAILAVGWAPG